MHVLSVSLDGDIATPGSEAYERQASYAAHFDSYTVVTKTMRQEGERIGEGPLEVLPTGSRNRYAFLLDAYRLAARRCRRRAVDVVTVQDPFALGVVGWALKRRFGVRLHTQVHTDFLDNPNWRSGSLEARVFARLGRFVLPRSDAIRVGTEHERAKVETLVGDVPVHVAPVRMDFDAVVAGSRAAADELRDRLSVGDRPVVLFVGRFVPAKDLGTWVDVARRVRSDTETDPVFVLVGDGPARDRLETELERAGLRSAVRLPGWVDRETLAGYYAMADVFLITSKYEGTSRVVVEAGMNEVPVVATPFAGAVDNVVDGETGHVAADPAGLATHVTELLEDADRRQRYGTAARRHYEQRFDPDTLREQYVAFLEAGAAGEPADEAGGSDEPAADRPENVSSR